MNLQTYFRNISVFLDDKVIKTNNFLINMNVISEYKNTWKIEETRSILKLVIFGVIIIIFMTLWFILKFFGIINTLWLLRIAPYIGGITLALTILYTVSKISKNIGVLLTEFRYAKSDVKKCTKEILKIKTEVLLLKEHTGNIKNQIDIVNSRLNKIETFLYTKKQKRL